MKRSSQIFQNIHTWKRWWYHDSNSYNCVTSTYGFIIVSWLTPICYPIHFNSTFFQSLFSASVVIFTNFFTVENLLVFTNLYLYCIYTASTEPRPSLNQERNFSLIYFILLNLSLQHLDMLWSPIFKTQFKNMHADACWNVSSII